MNYSFLFVSKKKHIPFVTNEIQKNKKCSSRKRRKGWKKGLICQKNIGEKDRKRHERREKQRVRPMNHNDYNLLLSDKNKRREAEEG